MITKKWEITGNIYTCKLLFFLTLSNQDLVIEDLDRYNLKENLKEEKQLFKIRKMKKYCIKKIT